MNKLFTAFAILATASMAHAQVTITAPWVRGTVPQQQATGAFMQITSTKDVRLIAASSPAIPVVEIHEMTTVGDVMKMRAVKAIDVVPGRATELKPGGYHIMLMALKQPLKAGDVVPLTLTFEDGATKKTFTQEVNAPVNALAEKGMPTMQHKH